MTALVGPTAATASPTPTPVQRHSIDTVQAPILALDRSLEAIFGASVITGASVATNTWTILRNQPIGLAIGNGKHGWEFEPSVVSGLGYTAGFVRGSYQGCAWTATRNLVGSLAPINSACAKFKPSYKTFTSLINCLMCSGGTAVRLTSATIEYANYRPGKWPLDPIRHVAAGTCVEWRWVSSDRQMVMVKDRAWSNNEASWIFISRSALPDRLSHGYQSSCGTKR
ncbi:MAG: hypothetical protein WCI34_01665 [Actinomycetes bacterium]